MARRHLGPRYEPPQRRFDGKSALDSLLKDAAGAITGFQATYPDEFDREVEAVEANDELSPIGKQRALKRIVEKFENHPYKVSIADAWIARAEAEVARLEAEISKRPSTEGLSESERIALELRRDRHLRDFRALPPETQRDKIREALDKSAASDKARDLLFGLMDDGLLDEATESRARTALRAGANPAVARALDELLGRTDYRGERDASTGALSVAKFSRDQYLRYLRERTGVDLSLDQLAEQHQLPRPVVEGKVMRLTRAAASNAQIFRQAQVEAEAKGLTLEVEPIQEASFGTNGVGGQGEGE